MLFFNLHRITKYVITILVIVLAASSCSDDKKNKEVFAKEDIATSNTADIEVTVIDFYSSEPVGGARVTINPGNYDGTTGLDGAVTFTGITSYRNYSAKVIHDDYSKEDNFGLGRTGFINVMGGQITTVTIPLKKSAVIRGTVTSSGSPLSDAFIVLSRIQTMVGENPTVKQEALVLTDENGNYQFNRLPEYAYNIRALADSHKIFSSNCIVNAGQVFEQNIDLTEATTSLSYTINSDGVYYGEGWTVTVDATYDSNNVDATFSIDPHYLAIIDIPESGDVIPGTYSDQFIGTVPGDHTVVMMLTDSNDVCKVSSPLIVSLSNHPTEAYPSIIPGPSVLPLLDSNTPLGETAGTHTVRPGENVFLRGWGRDLNLSSPETYNADAPMFDVYGNKNGDWGQSEFSFAWSLKDGSGIDRTSLLNATTSQNAHFMVPGDASYGEIFTAILTVAGDYGLAGDPSEISVVVADNVGNDQCASCHSSVYDTYKNTVHSESSVNCEKCHGPGSLHGESKANITKTHWPGNCGKCHKQFAQWQRSRHSDPLAFGHGEVSTELLGACYKCHYAEGFIGALESTEGFHDFSYTNINDNVVPKDTPNVGCDVCHDPHVQSTENPVGVRTGSAQSLCSTCHEKKWQNATYTGEGDKIGNAHHWSDYTRYQGSGNPHRISGGCVACHMANDITDVDDLAVKKVGGHTLRMREDGADGILGSEDDLLNIEVCQGCHPGLDNFNRNGVRSRIKKKLRILEDLLKENNEGYLPPFQSGKCATCHKGGTLPFIYETEDDVLDKAYVNYKLVLHDRSFGIHNPGYIEKLLDDSISNIGSAEFDNTIDWNDYAIPDSNDDVPSSGYGAYCDEATPCEGEIDYCLAMGPPGTPGTCTSQNCTADSCPKAYTCLDCTDFSVMDIGVFCSTEDLIESLLDMGCTNKD